MDRAKFIFSRGKEPPDRIQHDVVAIGQLVRVVDRPLAVPIRSSYLYDREQEPSQHADDAGNNAKEGKGNAK